MRTSLTFRYPAQFQSLPEDPGRGCTNGVVWFLKLLEQVPNLQMDGEPAQEDGGVVIFARRDGRRFWIGLGACPEGDDMWLAHVHSRSFQWQNRYASLGKAALRHLITDVHQALSDDPRVSGITWFHEKDGSKTATRGAPTPWRA